MFEKNNQSINSEKDFLDQKTNNIDENIGKSKIYWFFRNIVRRVISYINNNKLRFVIITTTLIILLFLLRAYIHPIALTIRIYFWPIVFFSTLLFYFLFKIKLKQNFFIKLLLRLIVFGFIVLLFNYFPSIQMYISKYYNYKNIHKIELSKFPITKNDRIHPINSIVTLVNQDFLMDNEESSKPHIIRGLDSNFYFSMSVGAASVNDWQRLIKNIGKIIIIPLNSQTISFDSEKNIIKTNFDIGENLYFSKNSRSNAIKRFNLWQYFNYEPDEVKYIEIERGRWVEITTLIRWKGWFFPHPEFGGLIVVEKKSSNDLYINKLIFGKGKFYNRKDIKNSKSLRNQNLIGEKISIFHAECFKFKNGFFAPFPAYHFGDIKIPKNDEDYNNQPYVINFDFDEIQDGKGDLYHYFGLEPYQNDKKALSVSVFIPSNGIDNKVYYIDHNKNISHLIGSSAVISKIKESRKNYDWTVNHPAETRPFIKIIDNKIRFMWLSTIVTKANKEGSQFLAGSIPELVMTDASTSEVFWIKENNLKNDSLWIKQVENKEYK